MMSAEHVVGQIGGIIPKTVPNILHALNTRLWSKVDSESASRRLCVVAELGHWLNRIPRGNEPGPTKELGFHDKEAFN